MEPLRCACSSACAKKAAHRQESAADMCLRETTAIATTKQPTQHTLGSLAQIPGSGTSGPRAI